MKSTMSVFVALFFLELFTLANMVNLSFCTGNSYVGCIDSEREALIKLKQDLIDPSNRLASWVGDGDCCKWAGVICSDLTCHHLIHLDLSGNNFQGIQIPKCLGSLKNLRYLNLTAARFAGKIPHQLGNLSNLQYLDLSDIKLHVDKFSWPSGLSLLEHLDLSRMNLGKASDLLPVTNSLPSLKTSHMSNWVKIYHKVTGLGGCHISGHLTNQLGQFKCLHTLELRDNSLSGPLPPALGELSSMTNLDLFSNTLNGAIPMLNGTISEIHFVNLTKLTSFSISENSLILQVNPNWVPPFQLDTLHLRSCHLGPHFPSWLHSQKHLSVLDISNTRISDTIPRWFWNSISLYESLNLSSNQIYGEIPNFDHPLPLVPSHGVLDLSNNAWSGSIFHLICKGENELANIDGYLKLSKNYFSGDIRDCWVNWPNLVVLNLGNNFFSGSLPISIGNLSCLQLLNLRNNRIVGIIPVSIQNCSNLNGLDMGENEFVGDIPA
ncbi:hypothetical protein CUMW_258540 [Citrus unshiu]|uniref:Leucine-rich repeat-containing N-terminal plant-type domain-containing protein n=1 Tax=Citrus unshiu TaxID=55188 RepID=A0A2H5QSU7_CITUN|nr:hypothetical protein CUMW_258540 [Citrus unshiu]